MLIDENLTRENYVDVISTTLETIIVCPLSPYMLSITALSDHILTIAECYGVARL